MKAKMVHRCIHVLDLEKSLAFYKRAFGLDVVREITRAEGSRKIVYIGNDTTDFELELVWESGRTEAYDNGSNDTHLAFAVDDVDAACVIGVFGIAASRANACLQGTRARHACSLCRDAGSAVSRPLQDVATTCRMGAAKNFAKDC